ncbi:hypothetical protein EDD85DRAFT_954766 [Armillaria nabsnona]|nr:hypothetical protein EDD85DRAFT_954766 [Armillaria nabsnona]
MSCYPLHSWSSLTTPVPLAPSAAAQQTESDESPLTSSRASLEYEDAVEFSPYAAEHDNQAGQAYDTSYDSMLGEWLDGNPEDDLPDNLSDGYEKSFTTSTPHKPEKPKEKPKHSCTVRIDNIIDYDDPIPEKHADAEWIGPISPEQSSSGLCKTASTSNKKGKSKSATLSSTSTTSGHAHSIQMDTLADSEQSHQSLAAPMNELWHASSQVPPNSFLG